MSLSQKSCTPCTLGTPRLQDEEVKRLAQELGPGWKVAHHQLLEKKYPFRNFREGLAFVNKVGALAEQEGHHPDIEISYTSVKVTLSTHKIHGLSHNDFILAAKIDLI